MLRNWRFQAIFDPVRILGFPRDAKPRLVAPMSETQSLPENILLIGIMGCGKSTVGRELQQRLGYPLVDMDQEIERMAGKPITAIFADEGEDRFRALETQVLRELALPCDQRRIISTGGGVIGSGENRRLLRGLGYVVWLDAPLEVILERTGKSRHRPLLHADDPAAKIRELMRRRAPLYQETAHLKLDTAGLDCGEIATGILECARYFFTHRRP
jgi:shikimate kinase